jgi:hypothetical protein
MHYPHWLMVAGAVLVMIGFIGFAFHKSNDEPNPAPPTRDAELKAKGK